MKITEKLPQFDESKTLVVVASFQSGCFYFAYRGKITKIRSFRIENPKYSDREGFFAKRKGGLYQVSGSVYEAKNLEVKKRSLKELVKNIEELVAKRGIEEICLFAPPRILSEVTGSLPLPMKKAVKKTIRGNYLKLHPFELLEKLREKEEKMEKEEAVSPKKEARKILKKSRRARRVIGK